MVQQAGIVLNGFKFEIMPVTCMSNQVVTYIRNGEGKSVGKFVTSGVGLAEHQRRFKAVVKRTIKCAKE
jgi:hypothetical protein